MTDTPRTPLDAAIVKAQARAEAARKTADDLAKRAREAARVARKAVSNLEDIDRKKRDRARYIIGGVMINRMLRKEPDWVRQWLDSANLSPIDRAIVEGQLGSVLGRPDLVSN